MLPQGALMHNPFTDVNTEPQLGNLPLAGQVHYEAQINIGFVEGYIIRGGGIADALILTLSSGI